jgi:hypothetical protein
MVITFPDTIALQDVEGLSGWLPRSSSGVYDYLYHPVTRSFILMRFVAVPLIAYISAEWVYQQYDASL